MKDIVSRITVSFAAAYTLYDLTWIISGGENIVPLVVMNAVANITGGVLFGVLSVLVLAVSDNFSKHVMHPGGSRGAYFSSIIVLLAVSISFAVYYGVRLFYQPQPLSVSLVTDVPYRGVYSTSWMLPTYGEKYHSHETHFAPDILPKGEKFELSGEDQTLNWNTLANSYATYISAFAGCSDAELSRVLAGSYSRQTWPADSGSVITSGMGVFTARSDTVARLSGRSRIASFWVRQTDDALGYAETLTNKNGLGVRALANTVVTERLSLQQDRAGQRSAVPRSVDLSGPGAAVQLRFVPEAENVLGVADGCTPLHLADLGDGESQEILVPSATPLVHVVLEFEALEATRSAGVEVGLDLAFKGDQSLLALETNSEEMEGSEIGRLHMVSIQTSTGKLRVDSDVTDISTDRHFILWGETDAAYSQSSLSLSANEAFVWLDGKRLHKTRWEQLPAEWQIALVTGFLAAIGYLLTRSSRYLRGFWGRAPRSLI